MSFSCIGGRVGAMPISGSQVQLNVGTLTASISCFWHQLPRRIDIARKPSLLLGQLHIFALHWGLHGTQHRCHSAIWKLFSLLPQVTPWVLRSETHIDGCKSLPGLEPQPVSIVTAPLHGFPAACKEYASHKSR